MRNRGLEVELLAQAHSAREQRSWDLNQRERAFPGAEAEGAGGQPAGLLNLSAIPKTIPKTGWILLFVLGAALCWGRCSAADLGSAHPMLLPTPLLVVTTQMSPDIVKSTSGWGEVGAGRQN